MRIGVDVGGTFTDVTGIDDAGGFYSLKLPSTPADQSVAVKDGVEQLLGTTGTPAGDVDYLGHGTTVATNTLLELDGSDTALVVTAGFRDLLEIGRQRRPSLYDLNADKPRMLVPRRLVFEVRERITASGEIVTPIESGELDELVARVRASGVAAVAVCLLHSYRDARHEEAIGRALAEALPELYVSLSSRVAPEFREYERASTTVINAYVGPRMANYVSRLEARAEGIGIAASPKIMQSNGGLVSPDAVAQRPVTTLLSGPSAGVIGAAWVAGLSGFADIVTFDMGGTSTDICVVRGGEATMMSERSIEGYTVRVPSVSVHTVGAGGGSIAAVDAAGALTVGPRSAGAVPGPAAYGRGGTEPTVTDANVVLGRQLPNAASGLTLDVPAARSAVAGLASALDTDEAEAAIGIIRLADSHMARAVRRVTVENGEDPREFALVAYGGAGPLHAVSVAAAVGVRTVIVPPHPGTLCSLGLLVTDLQSEFLRSVLVVLDDDGVRRIAPITRALEDRAADWFADEAVPEAARELLWSADLRYARQNFELSVPLDALAELAEIDALVERFHTVHEQSYGFAHRGTPVQLVNLRVRARRTVVQPAPELLEPSAQPLGERALLGTRPVLFDDGVGRDSAIYDRRRLVAGDELAGPAVLEQMDSTVLLPPGCTARVDRFGTLIVEVAEDAR